MRAFELGEPRPHARGGIVEVHLARDPTRLPDRGAGAQFLLAFQREGHTDGPFAETKDVVAGYSVVRAADRAEAIEIAKRYPHAKWGSIEVREMRSP